MLDVVSRGPLGKIRLDLTTRCNLRCVYCAGSQTTYHSEDMPAEIADRAMRAIIELSHEHRPREIYINGHGETTFIDGWVEVCASLLEHGFALVLTTNLAKNYSRRELEVLASVSTIAV